MRDEDAPVDEHPDRLDGVERHALGALEDLVRHVMRAGPWTNPSSSSGMASLGEGLEVQGGEVALARSPRRAAGP